MIKLSWFYVVSCLANKKRCGVPLIYTRFIIEEGRGWGLELTRPRIIQNIEDYFGDEIAVLSSPGLSHLLMFQCEAEKTPNPISCDEHGLDNVIYKVGTQITKKCLWKRDTRSIACTLIKPQPNIVSFPHFCSVKVLKPLAAILTPLVTLPSFMMTSPNGNIFRVTGPLCGKFTGHRWIPLTKASDAEVRCFLWSAPWINGWVNNREAADFRRHRAHYDVIVMFTRQSPFDIAV